jgi:integrase
VGRVRSCRSSLGLLRAFQVRVEGGHHDLLQARALVHRAELGLAPQGVIQNKRRLVHACLLLGLGASKRRFTLAIEADKLATRPVIKMLEEKNARTGFFEEHDLQRLLVHLPDHIKAVVEVAYYTSWRVASEILTRQWKHVDLTAGWLRLEPGETKNGEGRMFPLTGRLRQVLEEQRERTRVVEREQGRIVPWLFHRDGERVKSIRRPWERACRLAGLEGKIPHDFRRTAVRNLERAGVSRSVGMKLVGHKTEVIYRRYAIAAEADLLEGVLKADRFREISAPISAPVLPFAR